MRKVPRLYYALLLAVVVIALVLYGCQGVKHTSSSSPNNPGEPANPANPGAPNATPGGSPSPGSPTPSDQPGQINHIIVLLQENRSFDTYFGMLSSYWANHGYPPQPFDGLSLSASNAGCDPSSPAPRRCVVGPGSPTIKVFHLETMCIELAQPSWDYARIDFNRTDPANGPPTLDGFVVSAANNLRGALSGSFHDFDGRRAMGYYDGRDLNYYYFMASNFATSDRWFSPLGALTQPNRMFLLAATSHGHAYPLSFSHSPELTDKTIFQLLQENGVSWKIYVHPLPDGCDNFACLMLQSYINLFTFQNDILNKYSQNLVPISQYFTDLASGTLPQVAFIEPASEEGLDEHPSLSNPINVQAGANYASTLINALMQSGAWVDSVFVLSFDEFGGLYDHVPPQPAVSPDGIPPSDLLPGDVCTHGGGANCNFTQTGYRVPLIVISPYSKRNYVSHTVADYTAILKFIETRFNLPSLTARDAAQMDMSEFFDMANPPWMTPPIPPAQNTGGACYLDHLP
jgi:phospholipase C